MELKILLKVILIILYFIDLFNPFVIFIGFGFFLGFITSYMIFKINKLELENKILEKRILEERNKNKEKEPIKEEQKKEYEKKEEKKNEEEDNKEKEELYKSLWGHKQKIKYKDVSVFFKSPNQVHLCILKEYKKKDIEYGQVQILIYELFDKYEIEIYKFDTKKQYNDFETTMVRMKKKEKQQYYDYGKQNNDDDLELTLLEKVPVIDILSITPNSKAKNIITCEIRGEAIEKHFMGIFKKKNKFESINIVFDFSSTKEAKSFINSFKDLIRKYKESLKKNK